MFGARSYVEVKRFSPILSVKFDINSDRLNRHVQPPHRAGLRPQTEPDPGEEERPGRGHQSTVLPAQDVSEVGQGRGTVGGGETSVLLG